MWIAVQSHFGFECIVGDDLAWVCDKAGLELSKVAGKKPGELRVEIWNGSHRWVVHEVPMNKLQAVINEHFEMRRSKFS